MKNKSLVISGGGNKGAFSIGYESVKQQDYDLYVGSSTGALNVIMLAQHNYKEALEFYANASNNTIYDKSPFNRKNKLKIANILIGILKNRPSISTTNKLLDIIRESYTEATHIRLRKTKEIVVVVSNMRTKNPEYKSNKKYNWEDFTYWVWVSTLAYPFTNTIIKNGQEYADGGFSISLPLEYACKRSNNVRAIVLSEKNKEQDFKNTNIVNGLISDLSNVMTANLKKDISRGLHYLKHGVKIDLIYMPKELTEQSMLFIPKIQQNMIEMGKKLALENAN